METLFLLIAGHALADYPLQGDFLSIGKGKRDVPHNGVPWYYCLGAHALIHGGFVAVITGNVWLGYAELVAHWFIDDAKCRKWTVIHTDQALHIACKVAWWTIWLQGAT
jgi:hypothetical protein